MAASTWGMVGMSVVREMSTTIGKDGTGTGTIYAVFNTPPALSWTTSPSSASNGETRTYGFTISDVFVAGYGTDYAEKYRHLPYIGIVE